MLGLPALTPGEVLTGVRALLRSGVIRPVWPRPALLGLALETPLVRPNLGTAIALQAALQPRAVAVTDDVGMLSWGELDRRISRLANVFLSHGAPGDCAAFMLGNGREALECYGAGGRSGLAPVPLPTSATGSEIGRMLHMQRPAVLVVESAFDHEVHHAVHDLDDPPVVLHVGPGGSYERALAAASPAAPLTRGTSRIVIHTSGTTGAPKGAEREAGLSGTGAALGFLERIPLTRHDRVLIGPPLYHGFALGVAAAAMLVGATLVLTRALDASRLDELVRDHSATVAALVPVMLRRALDRPGIEPLAGPTGARAGLRMVVTSGSAMPAALRDAAQRRYGEVVHDLYGSTEAGWVAISTPEDFRTRRGTVGRPGPGMRVEVVDDDGERLGPGVVGRLRVATGLEFSGYTGSDAHRGPVLIGDLGYLDADGYLFITGRHDEMVISGGENVYPSEVEEVLEAHPAITEVAVVGVDDEEFGQVLRAYVVGAVDPDEVRTWLRARVARHKVPKRVVVIEELPRNAVGKVLKRLLLQAEHPAGG